MNLFIGPGETVAIVGSTGVGKTTVAHRLSAIQDADKIIVLEDTGIAEMGTHDQLISRNGIYARLHRVQVS